MPDEWMSFANTGVFKGSPLDEQDGYIHLSTAAQIDATVETYFANVENIIIVGFYENEQVKWEMSRNNILFPHWYGQPLTWRNVACVYQYKLQGTAS